MTPTVTSKWTSREARQTNTFILRHVNHLALVNELMSINKQLLRNLHSWSASLRHGLNWIKCVHVRSAHPLVFVKNGNEREAKRQETIRATTDCTILCI